MTTQAKQRKMLTPNELHTQMKLMNLPDDMIYTVETIIGTLQMKEGILGRTLDFLRSYMEKKQLDSLELTNEEMDAFISAQNKKNQQINIIINDDLVKFEIVTKSTIVTG